MDATSCLNRVLCILFNQQLTNQDKTPAVVSRAMAKHNLETEPEEGYELVQVISEERGKSKKKKKKRKKRAAPPSVGDIFEWYKLKIK